MYANNANKREYDANNANNILDRWILAKLNLLNQEITKNMKQYDVVRASRPIADFINELSTWYLRRSRERFKAHSASSGQAGDVAGINTLGYVLLEFSKLVAPFIPFTAEEIYKQVGGEKESVHLEDWPKVEKKLIDEDLLSQMDLARQIVEKGLAARSEAGVKIRQPLASYTTSLTKKLDKELIAIVQDELNVKKLEFGSDDKLVTEISDELKQEGLAREIIRQVNQQRKEAGLTIADKVVIYQDGLDEVFSKFGEEIRKATLAEKVDKGSREKMKEVEGGKVGIRKVN
jgi:isoleucyl-tRNA synthetase